MLDEKIKSLPDDIFNYILRVEGGYVDDKDDKGGETNYGISNALLKLARKKYPDLFGNIISVKDITRDLAYKIYNTVFWKHYKLYKYHFPINVILFDSYVQHHPRQVGITFQRSINVSNKILGINKIITVDGIIGNETFEAYSNLIEKPKIDILALEMLNRRAFLYSKISLNKRQRKFLTGWIKRLNILHNFIYGSGKT